MSQEKLYRIDLGGDFININTANGGGGLTNSLHTDRNGRQRQYNASIDGLETLLLSLACREIDVSGAKFKEAIKNSIEILSNEYL
jgi:hypothetical protein